MSFPDVLKRGEDFLNDYPRTAPWWNLASHATCLAMLLPSKLLLNVLYDPHLHNVEKLDVALAKARSENRSLLTVMNHMSVVDDPTFYAALPWRFFTDIDTIRWGFGAHNVCFSTPTQSWFFNLGKILGTQRFGFGPFQGSLDAAIRIMSPDDTLLLEFTPGVAEDAKPNLIQECSINPDKVSHLVSKVKPSPIVENVLMSKSPFIRSKTSWFHVFPEGFVLQLKSPHENSMRYFKWGVSRLILELTVAPVVVPIFASGFEKIAPEVSNEADMGIRRWLPSNLGAEVHICIGDSIDMALLELYREKWRELCTKYIDPLKPTDLSQELKIGEEVRELRSQVAAELRNAVSKIRSSIGLYNPEDIRFKDPKFWTEYTRTEGESSPDVQFLGRNWAVKRFQKHLPEYKEDPPLGE